MAGMAGMAGMASLGETFGNPWPVATPCHTPMLEGPAHEGPEMIASVPTMNPIAMPPPKSPPQAPTLSANTTAVNLAPRPSLPSSFGAAQMQPVNSTIRRTMSENDVTG
jgi:hypothetical protein